MEPKKTQRKLTTIFSADVQGYSRLMGDDEAATVRTLTAYQEIISSHIEKHGGRVIDSPGDNLLAEFGSVVHTVECSVEIQQALKARNDELPENCRMEFRVGVNVGDVIIEDDRIYGDGVNIAARLEGLAEGGGICISGGVFDQVHNKLDFGFEDLGEHSVKNIPHPVHAYRVQSEASQKPAPDSGQVSPPPLPDKPSVAVLPFTNMSSDSEQEYFADGMTEDLITDLSKISGLFVIARNSSFAFKGKSHDVMDVARRLRVRHVLEGSVRRAGNKVRINAQLIDSETGGHLWAERYDGDFKDIFALQDNITAKIISALEVHLTSAEREDADRKPTRSAEAYELCLKGRSEYYLYTPEHLVKAKQYFEQAIKIDPTYAEAYGYLSYCHTTEFAFAWPGADESLDRALKLAEKSIALNDKSSAAYTRLGWIQGFLGRFEQAIANFEKAISLDPRNAEAFFAFGETMNRGGKPERALPLLEKASSIDTTAPAWNFAKGHAFVLMRRYDEALSIILRAIKQVPKLVPAHVQLARAYSEIGRIEDAKREVEAVLEISPSFTIKNANRMFPYPNEEDRRRILDALRKAGLPE